MTHNFYYNVSWNLSIGQKLQDTRGPYQAKSPFDVIGPYLAETEDSIPFDEIKLIIQDAGTGRTFIVDCYTNPEGI